MKKNILTKLFFIVIFAFILLLINPQGSFASQKLNQLDFDILVRNNGDLDIVEKWNVYIEDTNTLFKTIKMDGTFDEITDVSVKEIFDEHRTWNFTQANEYAYHVEKNSYHALINPDKDFEIAWGVDVSGSATRTFEIRYTVTNHVTLYNDCAEVYWKLIGEEFEIPVEKINGKIRVPYGITNEDDFRIWAHGPLNGTINKNSTYDADFTVEDLAPNTFLEIRLGMPTSMFILTNKKVEQDKLNSMIQEEHNYATEANDKRERKAKTEEFQKIAGTVIGIVASLWCLKYFFTILKEQKENPKIEPEEKMKYFRELPDENATVMEAGFLYYLTSGGLSYNMGNTISATMLNLCLKGYLEFEEKADDKKEVIVKVKKGKKTLKQDEQMLYNYIKEISENNEFTMKEMERYNKKNTSKIMKLIKDLDETVEKEVTERKVYDAEIKKKGAKYSMSAIVLVLCMLAGFVFVFLTPIVGAILLIVSTIVFTKLMMYISRFNGLTQKGANEKEKWEALKRYMTDFSLLKEKEVPDLVLWEQFLVYATAFGISSKVIKQLKVKYPELNDEQYLRTHHAYMYIAFSNNNMNFINSMSSSIGSSINMSSGTGAGGGFSTGGGFGGGGRRWRRSLMTSFFFWEYSSKSYKKMDKLCQKNPLCQE